jgi:hypothetical protein
VKAWKVVKMKDLTFLIYVIVGKGAASYPMGTRGSFPRGKAAGT